jgi:7-cyano-7-deazaguanine synthase in queuosine biosynthesis
VELMGVAHKIVQEEESNIKKKINYVYWTGGYDSTYRICELLIVKKEKVQPIYLSYNLDSEYDTDFWVRNNRIQEKKSMNIIKKKLFEKYPYTKNLLNDTIEIAKNFKDSDYVQKINQLNLWPYKRRIHQYVHLGKISFQLKRYIDTGVLGIHNSHFPIFVKEHLDKETNKLKVSKNHPLHYLKFPLFGKTKKNLCDFARKHKFNDILLLTWSCWFPDKMGKRCGRCPMCLERLDCV